MTALCLQGARHCANAWSEHVSDFALRNCTCHTKSQWHGRFATRFARIDSRASFAIETPIFIAHQADSHESLEFPIRANHATKHDVCAFPTSTLPNARFETRCAKQCVSSLEDMGRKQIMYFSMSEISSRLCGSNNSLLKHSSVKEAVQQRELITKLQNVWKRDRYVQHKRNMGTTQLLTFHEVFP